MEIHRAETFASYFDGIRGRTLRVAACIPRDRLEWAPRAGAFSFGDLLRHLGAIERYMFAENAQGLPSRWDELTASDWPKALEKSSRTCILPIGILEKHGPHAPIGSDLIQVREWAARVTKKEYAVVFPDYFYGQINEARHQPGTFALPERVVWELLESTCEEIARNGFNKIVATLDPRTAQFGFRLDF